MNDHFIFYSNILKKLPDLVRQKKYREIHELLPLLKVFKNQPDQLLLYFDGFAGSGDIEVESTENFETHIIEGAAIKILKIDMPRAFDMYYFVEKKKSLAISLEAKIKSQFPDKEAYIQAKDCTIKLKDLANFLRSPKGKI